MSAQRKNSKALKTLRAAGLPMDGNFTVPYEGVVKFSRTSLLLNGPAIVDQERYTIKIDPKRARFIARQVQDLTDPTKPHGRPKGKKFRKGLTPRPWTVPL